EDRLHPVRPLAAGRALAARLVGEELGQAPDGVDDADRLVEDDDAGRAEHRAGLGDVVEGERKVDLARGEHRRRGAARDDRLQLAVAGDAAAVLVNELLEVHAHGELVDARLLHVAGDAVELRPGVAGDAERLEPLRAVVDDERDAGQGLDVVDDGRAAEDADDGREGRLDARLAAMALDGLDEARLLAADVGPRAAVDGDVEVEAAAENVPAEEALLPRFGQGLVQHRGAV